MERNSGVDLNKRKINGEFQETKNEMILTLKRLSLFWEISFRNPTSCLFKSQLYLGKAEGRRVKLSCSLFFNYEMVFATIKLTSLE